jgi:hypothetical protein
LKGKALLGWEMLVYARQGVARQGKAWLGKARRG